MTEPSHQQIFDEYIASYNLQVQCGMSGPLDAKIVLIGEYPGEQEAAMGRPFVGGAGRFLWNALRKINVLQPYTYCTNVIKRRVTTKTTCHSEETILWEDALRFEIDQLTEKEVIVCLGNAAMHALLGFDGITQHRGSVYEYHGIPVLCTYNPAFILRAPTTELVFHFDLTKVDKLVKGDYAEHRISPIINPSFAEALEYIREIQFKHKRFSIDIETIGAETACVGLGISAHDAMCINFRTRRDNRFTVEEEYKLLKALADCCDDTTTTTIAQNGNFDAYWMGYKDWFPFKVDFDTLLAHHTLYPLLPHNLGFLTAQYTTHPFYKDDKEEFKEGGDIDSFWKYNATDCAITFAVADKEEEELREQNLYDFFTTHVMRLQPHLSESTITGIPVNVEKKAKLQLDLRGDLQILYDAVQHAAIVACGDEDFAINPLSSKQMCEFLFDRLRLKATRRSADKFIREQLLSDPRVSMEIKNFLTATGRYVEEHKFISTYVETKIDPDSRFRAEFKQFGVTRAPGRLSSAQTAWGSGGNAQNQPHRAYEMYEPDDGCVLIYFDLSQAEARYVAVDANIEKWLEDFERARLNPGSFDAHVSLASDMFRMPYDEVPTFDFFPGDPEKAAKLGVAYDREKANKPTKRYIAKRCRHGLNYRMEAPRLAQTTKMTLFEASQNYYAYHRTNPELKLWWEELKGEAKRTRMLYNCYGRRLYISTRLDDEDALASVVAFKPQSSIGDKTQEVWYSCHEDDRWDMNKARIALNVHDALWGVATPAFANTALSIMKAHAEKPLRIKSTMTGQMSELIIPAEMKISVPNEAGEMNMSTMKTIDVDAASL